MFDLYFKDYFVSIFYDKDLRLGKAVWSGHLNGAEFKEATLLCLDLVERYELKGWLGDNRKMHSIEPADLQWSLEVFLPRVVAGSLLRLANLPSEYEAHRKAINIMHEKRDSLCQKLIIREFGTEEEAMDWLLELRK